MYDIITMIVKQMINVERLTSARSWVYDDKTQRALLENLNGRLRLWQDKERNDDLINFWIFCLFINVDFLLCVVIPFVFSCVWLMFFLCFCCLYCVFQRLMQWLVACVQRKRNILFIVFCRITNASKCSNEMRTGNKLRDINKKNGQVLPVYKKH